MRNTKVVQRKRYRRARDKQGKFSIQPDAFKPSEQWKAYRDRGILERVLRALYAGVRL